VKAYGASTLLGKHVSVKGDAVTFDFIGKKGVRQRRTLHDGTLARIVSERKTKAWSEPLFRVSDGYVRDYLHRIDGRHHVHDWRGWHATRMAAEMVEGWKTPPKDEKEFNRRRKAISEKVADFLGNTPKIALDSYISPVVWARWEESLMGKEMSEGGKTVRKAAGSAFFRLWSAEGATP
jgi:DNA topoisomerase IB